MHYKEIHDHDGDWMTVEELIDNEYGVHVTVEDCEHKTPFHLADLEFLGAMCDNFQKGIKNGRSENDWKNMEWSEQEKGLYKAKIVRHLRDSIKALSNSEELEHIVSIACNANILWHHLRGDEWTSRGQNEH